MPITTLLDAYCPSIRITGEIDMQLCFALIDEMKLLHDYYQFRNVELQIDSPGGNADALYHLVQFLAPWRRGEGRVLKTTGLNEIASAAAILLSFGTVGHRSASQHSRLLYHHVRTVFPHGSTQTGSQLRTAGRRLDVWEQKFLDLLVNHVTQLPEQVSSRHEYRKKLRRLLRQERFISAAEACELGLIDRVL